MHGVKDTDTKEHSLQGCSLISSGNVMTVVEFHSEAGEFQYIFISKNFLISCKTVWWRAVKNWTHSYYKSRIEKSLKLTMSQKRIVFQIHYFDKKTIFGKVKLIVLFGENWYQKLKISIFWQPSERFCKMSKNSLRMFIWMQKTIGFHLSPYNIP